MTKATDLGKFASAIDVDSSYISLDRDIRISGEVLDSSWVQSRQVTYDSSFVQSRQITYNTSNFTDSAWVSNEITAAIGNLVDGAPGALDTLNELAAALNDDASAYSSLVNLINEKLDSAQTISLVDSAYVNARVSTVDSAQVQAIINSEYIQANQITYNTSNFVDSNYVATQINNVYIPTYGTDFVDSAYVSTEINSINLLSNGAIQVPLVDSSTKVAIEPNNGMLIYNTTDLKLQLYNDSNWQSIVTNREPVWQTSSGSLATIYHAERSYWDGVTLSATDADNHVITYSIISGSLPSGLSLNSSTGAITGTADAVVSDTTSTFTVRAIDELAAKSDRQFSITVKAPVVTTYNYTGSVQTWTKPAGVTYAYAVMWGGGGGGGNPGGQGGAGGGYTKATMDVSNISTLAVIVGQLGVGENNYAGDGNGNGCGGGLSGIFTQFTSDRLVTYAAAILVAGGGGGGGNNGGYPGTGGGTTGVTGSGGQGGGGGTQTAGGSTASSGGTCTSNCTAQQLRGANGCGGAEFAANSSWPSMYWGGVWSAGAGGNGCNAGGGGGGYWGGGGGGGSPNGGQGGGGSGYIGGHASVPVYGAVTSSNGNSVNPAGTSDEYYTGDVGKGASAAELDGNNGMVVVVY